MSQVFSTDEVLETYVGHPLNGAAILRRLNRNGVSMTDAQELDLAIDTQTEITDQNHIDGARSTLRLGARASLTSSDRVIDLGCGLGGPARLIADIFGVTVVGLDANTDRISDAISLTETVGLGDRTSFKRCDFLTAPLERAYSVVWAQNTWSHIDEPKWLADIASSVLMKNGRLAFEDICLRRQPANDNEAHALSSVSRIWRSAFSSESQWAAAFQHADFAIRSQEAEDAALVAHLFRLTASASASTSESELAGWKEALSLARAGVIGYSRMICYLL